MTKDIQKTIKEFKAGDATAFDTIYHMYSKKLYRFAFGLLKDHDLASEMVQEVFVNLWIKRDQVVITLNLENYIFTITYNSIRRYFRRKSIENKVKSYLLNNSPDFIKGTDESVIFDELLEIANSSIEKLPDKRKTVYKLSRQEGLKIKEIASTLNISPRTVETHLSKALKFLKEELAGISLIAALFYYLFIS